ncbi:hypothetical protein ZWY2020_036108 [Hordeum vulgare]|nr:hypothetical protein ZWY2020_036108 [Hordeum vulgare]
MQDPPPTGETPHSGSVAPICNPKGLPSQQDDGSQGVKVIPSLDDLPEDICQRIHARMPLRDLPAWVVHHTHFGDHGDAIPTLTYVRKH